MLVQHLEWLQRSQGQFGSRLSMPCDFMSAPTALFVLLVSHARPTSKCFVFRAIHLSIHTDTFFAQACTAVAFRTFAMREGLRRAIAATPLHQSITEWPAWTAEVLTYSAVLGQGLRTPDPERMDRASCSRLAAVLLHKDVLAAAVASEGLHSCDSRTSIPKSASCPLLHWQCISCCHSTDLVLRAQVLAHESGRPERGPHSAAAQGATRALFSSRNCINDILFRFVQADNFVLLEEPPTLPLSSLLPAKWVCRDNLLPMVRLWSRNC
jgi:hypothetical protein